MVNSRKMTKDEEMDRAFVLLHKTASTRERTVLGCLHELFVGHQFHHGTNIFTHHYHAANVIYESIN